MIGAAAMLALSPVVTVGVGGDVRLRDVVVGAGVEPAVAMLVVLRVPARQPQMLLSAASVASLVRRRVPGVVLAAADGNIIFRRVLGAPRARPACAMTRRSVGEGDILLAADLASTPCRAAGDRSVRYDRAARAPVYSSSLPSGGYVGRVAGAPDGVLGTGAALTLRATAGPVTVERAVTTLQPGRSGKRVFVRDAEGAVLSVPLQLAAAAAGAADDLYKTGNWPALAADRRATAVGDALTVIIYQAAEASNTAQTSSRKATDLTGRVNGGSVSEGGNLTLGGGYAGRGETRRSERLVTQLSVTVTQVLGNGDLMVTGRQRMHVNGEKTEVGVRGRIRPNDISPDNTVISSRIADAEIAYGGRGFVTRSAKPGLLNRLFSLLGLG